MKNANYRSIPVYERSSRPYKVPVARRIGAAAVSLGLFAGASYGATKAIEAGEHAAVSVTHSVGKGVANVGGAVVDHINGGHSYSDKDFDAMPQALETVDLGNGANQELAAVYLHASQLSPAEREGLVDYINSQGKGPHHMLMAGQEIHVPEIPGYELESGIETVPPVKEAK